MEKVMNPIERLDRLFGEIPHSVQIFDLYKVTNETCTSILKRLESEERRPTEGEEEVVRRTNLITILLFRLKQPKKALAKNERILEKYPHNVTALVNKICIKMASGFEREAEDLFTKLKSEWYRDGQDFLRASAFADEAYSLSRIMPKFFVRSIELFTEALEKFPGNHSWKFGCALSCKRCLSLARGVTNISSDDLKRFCEMAVSFFFEVASHGNDTLSALSWAHLGELLGQLKKALFPLSDHIVSVAITLCPFSAEKCLIKALQCPGSQNHESVLERCGHSLQFARPPTVYEETLQDCYTLLVKAYNIRPTSYGCDKLAEILRKMAELGIHPRSHSKIFCLEETETVQGLSALHISSGKPSVSTQHNLNRNPVQRTQASSSVKPFYKGKKKAINAAIPSTRVVEKHPGHPLLIQAVEYLKTSVQLTEETSMAAIKNLGMMYRRLDRSDIAIETFRKILSFAETSIYDKVNAYEQIGFSQLDISENPRLSAKERQTHREQGKFMLIRAMEEAARLVASLPTMTREHLDSLESYPTLRQLLSNDPQPEHMKDIARLCQLIGNYGEALDWYTKLQQINPSDIEALQNVVVNHMRLKDFKTAHNSFNVLMGSSEGRQLLKRKPDLFKQVYLGTIRHLMSSTSEDDMDHLKMSCMTLFDYKHCGTPASAIDENCQGYDVFILDDPDETEAEAEVLKKWLTEKCGLNVTRNDDDVSFGSYSFLHEAGFIANCKIVIVVLSSEILDTRTSSLLSIAMTEKGSGSIVSVKSEEFELPSLLKGSLSVKRPQAEEGDPEHQKFLLKCFMATLGLGFDTFQWIE